ncbi:MAG: SMC-Scp complex subunit ScpB [Oscillospiraceae bacterium]|nr:SMC-Scp complex subunit ScpB [Oscillospiraceae bacterium]
MKVENYQAIIEAILFASGEPVQQSRIAQVLDIEEDTVIQLADDLMHEVNTRAGGLRIVRLDDSYQMCTKSEYAEYIRKALDIRRNTPLSQAAMEVLAIIAYNQPVTRAFIEQVRGVDCGAVIQGLVSKSLIEEKGRLELPGRPLLYGTTADFLRCFGISSLEQLPPMPQKDEDNDMHETTLDEVIEDMEHSRAGINAE